MCSMAWELCSMFEFGIPTVDLFVKERSCSVRLEAKLEDGRVLPCVLVGNVADMSATCRRHTTLSADFGDMACLCRHAADMLPRVL